jgi:HEAT repeat protein
MHKTYARTLCAAVAIVLFATTIAAGDESLETLLAYLKSPNVSTRRDAAKKLGERRERNQLAVEALSVTARKDEDRDVRLEAVNSLG